MQAQVNNQARIPRLHLPWALCSLTCKNRQLFQHSQESDANESPQLRFSGRGRTLPHKAHHGCNGAGEFSVEIFSLPGATITLAASESKPGHSSTLSEWNKCLRKRGASVGGPAFDGVAPRAKPPLGARKD